MHSRRQRPVLRGSKSRRIVWSTRECPPELRTAWATIKGPVHSPNAKCSRTLARIGAWKFSGGLFSAGSRSLCSAMSRTGRWRRRSVMAGTQPVRCRDARVGVAHERQSNDALSSASPVSWRMNVGSVTGSRHVQPTASMPLDCGSLTFRS